MQDEYCILGIQPVGWDYVSPSTVTKADICQEFGDWYFSRIKLPEEEREKFKNEWNDLVRDYIAEREDEE